MKKTIGALALCLLLPLSALAVTEGVVEDAPPVDMQAVQVQEISYLPDESYYAGSYYETAWEHAQTWMENEFDGEFYLDVSQNPFLTAGEIARAEKLLEDYKAGKAAYTGESVLEKMDGVIVGVYALDPDDYDGETAFVLLPGTCLTDEQLLSLIAAYDEMGLEFDPSALNYRNCARGGGIETNRFFAEEERERYMSLADCIRRGTLIPPDGLEGLLRNPKVERARFGGMRDFSIKPYRPMTDEELVSLLIGIGVHDERGEVDHTAVEARARSALYAGLRCPLSMQIGDIFSGGTYTPELFTADGRQSWDDTADVRKSYGAYFSYHTSEGILVHVNAVFDKETNEVFSLSAMHDSGIDMIIPPEDGSAATQEKIDAAIAEVEKRLDLSGLAWHARPDEKTATNWGVCVPVRAQAADDWFFTLYIGSDDGQLHGLELTRGTLVDELPELDWMTDHIG